MTDAETDVSKQQQPQQQPQQQQQQQQQPQQQPYRPQQRQPSYQAQDEQGENHKQDELAPAVSDEQAKNEEDNDAKTGDDKEEPDEKEDEAANEKHEAPQPPQMHPLVAHLRAQMYHQRRYLDSLEVERSQYRMDIQSLSEKLAQVKTRIRQRDEARQQLQRNYNDHLKSIRATNDDLESILAKLKQLKQLIRELAEELMEQGDPVTATAAIRTFWMNLHDRIDAMGNPLPLHRLRMLTEKFIMDVLIQNMNINDFPGLPISPAFLDLTFWFDKYQPEFSTRLRQEVTATVVKTNVPPDSDTYTAMQKACHKNWRTLYGGLIRAFPFIFQYDKHETDTRKHYSSKVRRLVERSINLGFAMKGQEVDVAAAETRERQQMFDPLLMIDEDGQTAGIVDFCICPPFVVYEGNKMYTLEKGRVLCSPQEDADKLSTTPTTASAPIKT
ncbi:hypothetical protein BC940DRAFT_295093 [Gongronella butleri]|nr:hypothetical protein BC940DRAFT_295093 [Gongronella butleri]